MQGHPSCTSRVTAIIMFLILDSPLPSRGDIVIVSVSVTTCCHFVTTGALKPFVAPNTVGNSVCLLEGWRLHLWKVGWILFCIGGDCSSAALSVSLVGSILELAGISLWNSFKWCIRRSFNIKAPCSWRFSPLRHKKFLSKEFFLSSIEAGLPLFPGRVLSVLRPIYKPIDLVSLNILSS